MELFLKDIFNDFESSTCNLPCTYFSYTFIRAGHDHKVKLVFDKTVYLSKTSFLLDLPSMLMGLVGPISGGRTLLWCITSALGIIKIAEQVKSKKNSHHLFVHFTQI